MHENKIQNMLIAILICICFGVFSANSVADEKNEMIRESLEPIANHAVSNLSQVFKNRNIDDFSAAGDLASYVPKEIYLKNVFSEENLKELFYRSVSKRSTYKDARTMQVLFGETAIGKAMSGGMGELYQKHNLNVVAYVNDLLSRDRSGELKKDLFNFIDVDDLKSIQRLFEDVGRNLVSDGHLFVYEKVSQLYSRKKISEKDIRLCYFFSEGEYSYASYSIPICDSAHIVGDFRASMLVARSYYQGVGEIRSRNIEKAKEIYRSILDKDDGGEAHYYLGMLMKNTPRLNADIVDSYCFLKKSSSLGFERAERVLNEFESSIKSHGC